MKEVLDYIKNPLDGNMIDVMRLVNLYHLLSQVIIFNIGGEVVELGCHSGCSAILLQKVINYNRSKKKLHLYDSFEGLPEYSDKDRGSLKREDNFKTSVDILVNNFKNYNVNPPKIHKGWFKDTLPKELPDKICFAHLDGDVYSSIEESLKFIYPKISKKGGGNRNR